MNDDEQREQVFLDYELNTWTQGFGSTAIKCCRCDTVIASEFIGPKAAVYYSGHGFCKSCYNGDPR